MAVDMTAVTNVVTQLGEVISRKDVDGLSGLWIPDGWYRDFLVTTWQYHTVPAASLKEFFGAHGIPDIQELRLDASQPVEDGNLPLQGKEAIVTAFLTFTVSKLGTGRGFLRLVKTEKQELCIFTLFLSLYSLDKHQEPLGLRRPLGTVHSSDGCRPNWLEARHHKQDFNDEEPTVLIVGAGHSGLMLAARLSMGGISCLVVEKSGRVGDSWRKRYSSLVTHVPIHGDHFPYLPYPRNWPIFTPKDKLANWYELYVEAMELNVWTDCNVVPGTSYDDSTYTWSVPLQKADGSTRILHPKHVVQATGHSGQPQTPKLDGMEAFMGDLMHSSVFYDGAPWVDKKAVVIGCCNSAHDIAQNLYEKGAAEVTMVQRSATLVSSAEAVVEHYMKPLYAEDGPYYEDADIIQISTPIPLLKQIWTGLDPAMHKADANIHKGLAAAGFKLDMSPGGLYWKYYTRGGGYYIDVGCSQLIADGKITIKQGVEVTRFLPDAIEFKDGSILPADVVILATGYDYMNTSCEKIFGPEIAKKTGPVWGLDDEGELKGIWRGSGHPGFWYMGGSFQLARVFSRYLALQIMAVEDGVMPRC